MKFASLIKQEEVFTLAIKLVKKSHKELLLTMDLAEELKSPLPQSYHDLVLTKAKNGISVRRLGFGRIKDFQSLSKEFVIENISFSYAGSLKNYQRMLIVDRKHAIFKVGDQVIYSNFEPLVLSLVKFFEIIYNQRKDL